jgi:hypothetical protein
MSTIDKQRIAAVRKLERLGYTFAAVRDMLKDNTQAVAELLKKRREIKLN